MSILNVVGRVSGKLPILVLFLVFTSVSVGYSQTTRYAVASGNSNTGSTWSPAGTPSSGDVLIINAPYNVTMNVASIGWSPIYSVVVNNGGTLTRTGALTLNGSGASITVNSGGTVNVSGLLTVNQASFTAASGSTVSVGSLTTTAATFSNNGSITSTGAITTSGTFVNNGSLSGSALTASSGTFSNGGSLAISGLTRINGAAFTSSLGSTASSGTLDVTNSGGSSFTNGGTFTTSGNATLSGTTTNNGTMNIGGNATGSNAVITNSGTMNISGNLTLPSSSKFYSRPGGVTTVTGDVTTSSNENLIVGTGTNPPPYADFIIKGDLISTGSGDVLIDRNGRIAVFGDFSANGGGSIFTINDGGQVYINGTINMNGGGNHITNNNDGIPYYGFYSPHQPTYSGGGSNSNGAAGSNTVQDVSHMPTEFYNWVSNIPGSPLTAMPVTVLNFSARFENKVVLLSWITTSEADFSHFEVEQAGEDFQFHSIGEVKGAGYTTEDVQRYAFTDSNPTIGVNYYRLKAVDTDGSFEYFDVVKVSVTEPKTVNVYANPSDGEFVNVKTNFNPGELTRVVVYTSEGTIIGHYAVSGRDSRIDFTNRLTSGTYLLKYVGNDFSQVVRFAVK